MYAYGIDLMDVCLCGILFGLNTNKNSTKISQLSNCAYVCCSCWVFFIETSFSVPSRVCFPTKLTDDNAVVDFSSRVFRLQTYRMYFATANCYTGGRCAEFPCETSDWEWKVLVSCTAEMNSEECRQEVNQANRGKQTHQLFLHLFFGNYLHTVFKNLLFFSWLLAQFQHFSFETNTFLHLDVVQFEPKVEYLWQNKHSTGWEQERVPPTSCAPQHNLHQLPENTHTSTKGLNCLEVTGSTFTPGGKNVNGNQRAQKSHQQIFSLCERSRQFVYMKKGKKQKNTVVTRAPLSRQDKEWGRGGGYCVVFSGRWNAQGHTITPGWQTADGLQEPLEKQRDSQSPESSM